MKISVCALCGAEIEAEGIRFRGKVFCSDECCDEFEGDLATGGDEIEIIDDDDDDLGDDFDGDDVLDDDFELGLEDY